MNDTIQFPNINSGDSLQVMVASRTGCYFPDSVFSHIYIPQYNSPVINYTYPYLIASAGAGYQWYAGGNLIPGATQQHYQPAATGNYSVEVTDSNNCSVTSAGFNFVFTNILKNDISFSIFPNPCDNYISINSIKEINNYIIEDITGKEIKRRQTLIEKNVVIDTRHLVNGIYLLKLQSGETISKQMIVVDHL